MNKKFVCLCLIIGIQFLRAEIDYKANLRCACNLILQKQYDEADSILRPFVHVIDNPLQYKYKLLCDRYLNLFERLIDHFSNTLYLTLGSVCFGYFIADDIRNNVFNNRGNGNQGQIPVADIIKVVSSCAPVTMRLFVKKTLKDYRRTAHDILNELDFVS